MDANSEKVMEKYVEKPVAATTEESLGGTEEAPKAGTVIKEGSSGGTKEASKTVAATTEESLGDTKEVPKSDTSTKEGSIGGTKEASNSVAAATIEESLEGNKKTPKKSTVKPLETTLRNTSGNKAALEVEAKADVDVESKADTSVKPKTMARDYGPWPINVDANPSVNKEQATTFERKAAREEPPTGFKRLGPYFVEDREAQEKCPNKKFKIGGQEEVVDINKITFNQSVKWIKSMTRRELEDLVIQKIIQEKENNSELQLMRSKLTNSKYTLQTYQYKIAELNKQVQELNMLATTSPPQFVRRSNRTVCKKVTETVKNQSHAAGSMFAPSIGLTPKAWPFFEPKPDPNAPKCSTKVRPAPPVYGSTIMARRRQTIRGLTLPNIKQNEDNVVSKETPPKETETFNTVNAGVDQSANNAEKNTSQSKRKLSI